MANAPYIDARDPFGEHRAQAQNMVKRPESASNPGLRQFAIDQAMRVIEPGSSPSEVIAMAREIEQFVLGRPHNPPMKEHTNG